MKDNIIVPDIYEHLFKKENGVVKYPSEILRIKSTDVNDLSDAKKIISKMSPILLNTGGVGLAAPQIGVNKRIILIRHEQRYALVNPVIEDGSGVYLADEGCLSIPGLWGKVERFNKITLKGTSPHGKEVVLELEGMDAVIPQHEIDHLDGILFFDKAIENSLYWWSSIVNMRILAELKSINPQNQE